MIGMMYAQIIAFIGALITRMYTDYTTKVGLHILLNSNYTGNSYKHAEHPADRLHQQRGWNSERARRSYFT